MLLLTGACYRWFPNTGIHVQMYIQMHDFIPRYWKLINFELQANIDHILKKYIAFESVSICKYSNMSPKVNIKAWTAIGQVKMWMRLLVRSPTSHEIIQSQRVRLVIHNAIYRESTDRHEQVSRADVYWPQSKFWLY